MAKEKIEVIELKSDESFHRENLFGGEITIKEGKKVGRYTSGDGKFTDHVHIDEIKAFLKGRKSDGKAGKTGKANKADKADKTIPATPALSKKEQDKADAIASATNPNQ